MKQVQLSLGNIVATFWGKSCELRLRSVHFVATELHLSFPLVVVVVVVVVLVVCVCVCGWGGGGGGGGKGEKVA